ncbi:MAG: hypothetical protein ACXV97_10535 [Chthoniobacterales bacterium]
MNRSLGASALLLILCASVFGAPLEEVSDQTYPMPPNGSLSVRNTDGTVYIFAWLNSGVRIMSRKRAYTPERIKQIAVNVSTKEDGVTVDTSFPPKPPGLSLADRSGTVDYLILVPQRASIAVELSAGEIWIDGMYGQTLTARLTNGRITFRNCFSDSRLKLDEGALLLAYDWWEPLRFSLVGEFARGPLRVYLPGYSAVQVDAESGDGKVFSQFTPDEERRAEMGKLKTVIGRGNGAEFKLRAPQGNIEISKVE